MITKIKTLIKKIKNDNENNDEKNQGFERSDNLSLINNINNEIDDYKDNNIDIKVNKNEINLLNKKRERMNKLVKNPNHNKIMKKKE